MVRARDCDMHSQAKLGAFLMGCMSMHVYACGRCQYILIGSVHPRRMFDCGAHGACMLVRSSHGLKNFLRKASTSSLLGPLYFAGT